MNETIQWIGVGIVLAIVAVWLFRRLGRRKGTSCGCGDEKECASSDCPDCPLRSHCHK